MKFLLKTLALGFLVFVFYACEQDKKPVALEPMNQNLPKADSLVDQFSYVQGYEFGFYQSFDSIVLNFDYFMQGYWDAFNKKDAMFNKDSIEFIKQSWMQKIQELRDLKLEESRKKMEEVGKVVLERDQKFMLDIRQKEGMITRPSGLVYKIIQQGKGPVPTNEDFVKMHFVQKLTDGKVIDSTYKGDAFNLPVQAVYAGWNEALRMMPVGSIWELYIPPHLAFRDVGFGDLIPPHSAIILRIELISILEGEDLQRAIQEYMQLTNPGGQGGGPGGQGGGPGGPGGGPGGPGGPPQGGRR